MIIDRKLLFLSTGILIFVFCSLVTSPAAELKPIQEINLCTWTKAQYPAQYEEAFLIAENWRKVGLEVRVEPINFPNPLAERLMKSREFDAIVIAFVPQLERLDPDFYMYNAFHSANAGEGGWNMAGFLNKEFDKLAEAQRTEYDLNKRKTIIDRCQEFIYQENPWTVIVNQLELQAYNKGSFKDPVISKIGGFNDAFPFFTIKPTGNRKIISLASFRADINTINPLLVSEATSARVMYLIYDTLVRIGPDTKPQLWAAKEIKTVDPKTIDVTIRSNLKFHDGKALTADDVKFTFDFMIKHKAAYFKTALNAVASVDILDRYKVRFHLNKPYAAFVTQTLAMPPLLPKHIWEKIENPTEYQNVPPVGSGPFKFDHWRKAQEVKMSRFSDHFNPPYVEGVLVVFYGTREACSKALVQKETDVVDLLLPHQLEEFRNYGHIQTIQVPSIGSDTLVFNLRRKPFNDPKFRLAMSYTVPRKQILEELYNGYGNLGGSVIAPANEFWTNLKIKPYPFDLEKAREILKDAGYRWDRKERLCYPAE